jgi:PAS domain S-box-containing protein
MLLVLLSIIPSFGFALYTCFQQRWMAQANALQDTVRLARTAADKYERSIEETRQLLVTLAGFPEFRHLDPEACRVLLVSLLKQDPRYANFGAVRPDGTIVCSALSPNAPESASGRAWFQRAVATREFAVGNYQIGSITKQSSINCGYPVFDEAGNLQCVVFAALRVSWLNELMTEGNLPSGSSLTVVDGQGIVVARQPDSQKWVGHEAEDKSLIEAALTHNKGGTTESLGIDGIRRLYTFIPLTGRQEAVSGVVCVGVPAAVVFAQANRALAHTLELLAAAALLVLLIAKAAAGMFVIRRIHPILYATRKLSAGDLSARTGVTSGPDELKQLAAAFDQMAESLECRDARQKETEQSLRESEGLFRALSTSSPLGIFMADVDGRRTYANPRYRAILGLSLAQCLGEGWLKTLHPEDHERVADQWQSFVRGEGEYCTEGRLITNGSVRWVQARAAQMVEDDGALCGFVGTIEDITERKLAEEALRQSEQRYRSLIETARDAIFTLSVDGTVTSLNPAFEAITGWPVAEWIEKPYAPLVHPDDLPLAMQMVECVLRGETPPPYEVRIRSKTGQDVMGEFTVTPQIQDGQVTGVLGIARDITERKQLEEQLRQAQKMEAVGRLAGGVAHDFNNILTAINGYSELLAKGMDERDPHHRYVEEISKAGNRAASLTRQLLAFSRKQVLQPLVLDLNTAVADIEKMLRRLIGEHIELKTVRQDGLGFVKADPGQMEQVLLNLTINARDAMPDGGTLTIETANVTLDQDSARLDADIKPGDYVMLAISDTGIGMTEEVKRHLFEPFFTTKAKGKGTGLGLATCFGIVKQSGGHITVESQPGKGATFRIYLHRVGETVPGIPASSPNATTLPRARNETVLLVEDEPSVRRLASLELRELGYNVMEAAGGDEALELARQRDTEGVDLLLTDVVMPQMSGKELADKIRAAHPRTKVLFISGYTDDVLGQKDITNRDAALLQKPFNRSALAHKVREVLDGRSSPVSRN